MKSIPNYLIALLGASILPALMFIVPYGMQSLSLGDEFGWMRIRHYGFLTLSITLFHVFMLGGPLFGIMYKKKLITRGYCLLGGFVVGCLPIAIWSWPWRYTELHSSAQLWDGHKMVPAMIDGMPTLAGWLSYLSSVSTMGVVGVIGGWSFWFIWQSLHRNVNVAALANNNVDGDDYLTSTR